MNADPNQLVTFRRKIARFFETGPVIERLGR
jgi:hypothetical protein